MRQISKDKLIVLLEEGIALLEDCEAGTQEWEWVQDVKYCLGDLPSRESVHKEEV
jgi:hypothetical protein